MIKIYFDENLIDNDSFAKITKSGKVCDGVFKVGATICEVYEISVNKENFNEIPEKVYIYDDDTLLKTLYVIDADNNDDFLVVLKLEDAMTQFNFRYDASQIFIDGHTTLGAIFEDICEKANIETDIESFYGSDRITSLYDNTYMARDYLSYIAELNGKNFRISADNKLEFVDVNTEPIETIDFDDISNFKLGDQHTITRVVYGDWQYGEDTGETYYINEDNVYISSQEDVEHIYNELNGFTYYNFKTNNCILTPLKLGDLVEFTYENNSYVTFVQFDNANFAGEDWFGGLEVNFDNSKKIETQVVGEAERYRRIKRIVDQQTGTIIQIVEEQNEQGERMTSIEQSVSQIESEIQDIPVITTEASGTGNLSLTNLLNMRLIELKIHPTDKDIIGLFASTNLKVAIGLKALSRGITFDGDEDYYYMIPDNLYYLGDVYDEFIYNGAEQTIKVIHRIGIENDEKYVLDEPIIEEFDYYDIIIGDGNYSIFMSSYPTAYIYIKAMIKNDYTTNFATSYELDSSIKQTASSIGLNVEQFKNGEKVNGALIMAQINNDESEIQINADKIDIDGKAVHFKTNINDTLGPYVSSDLTRIQAIIEGQEEPTPEDYEKYDIDGDGRIEVQDYLRVSRAISQSGGYITKTGTFQINPYSMRKTLAIWSDELQDYVASLSLYGSYFNETNTKKISLADVSNDTTGALDSTHLYLTKDGDSLMLNLFASLDDIEGRSFTIWNGSGYNSRIEMWALEDGSSRIYLYGKDGNTTILNAGITTPSITQTSKEEDKKDFQKLEKALDIIKDIDIYKYHLKSQDKKEKKHIGFVIGDKYKYSKEITSNDNDGVDVYSFVSVCCKAIQEQQEQIENLKEEIKKLKGDDK